METLIKVVAPIGKVPMYRLCIGCCNVTAHSSGNSRYFDAVIAVKRVNRNRFKKKKISVNILKVLDSVAYGKTWKSCEMAPVPIFQRKPKKKKKN